MSQPLGKHEPQAAQHEALRAVPRRHVAHNIDVLNPPTHRIVAIVSRQAQAGAGFVIHLRQPVFSVLRAFGEVALDGIEKWKSRMSALLSLSRLRATILYVPSCEPRRTKVECTECH